MKLTLGLAGHTVVRVGKEGSLFGIQDEIGNVWWIGLQDDSKEWIKNIVPVMLFDGAQRPDYLIHSVLTNQLITSIHARQGELLINYDNGRQFVRVGWCYPTDGQAGSYGDRVIKGMPALARQDCFVQMPAIFDLALRTNLGR